MKKLIFLIVTLVLFTSCEKDDVTPAQGEINAKQLKKEVDEHGIKSVFVYERSNDEYREWEQPNYGDMVFTIEKYFINVSDISDYSSYTASYDLSKLLKYNISYSSKTMTLYFGD
jgi:hypothetical protein